MKKRRMFGVVIIGIFLVCILFSMVVLFPRNQKKYTNLFEYAITLDDVEYQYAPKRLKFGMRNEEILEKEKINEYVLKSDSCKIVVEKTLVNVFDELDEVNFKTWYYSDPDVGLIAIKYLFTMKPEYQWKFGNELIDQANTYMPEVRVGKLSDIAHKECEIIWDEYENLDRNQVTGAHGRVILKAETNANGEVVISLCIKRIARDVDIVW